MFFPTPGWNISAWYFVSAVGAALNAGALRLDIIQRFNHAGIPWMKPESIQLSAGV